MAKNQALANELSAMQVHVSNMRKMIGSWKNRKPLSEEQQIAANRVYDKISRYRK